ncbi:hypothetical protein CALVIDRAFT_335789 [Calocera viscosa TUFC12733]|uniref:Transmembrane protein n=1 Tax=Calocera viscosa (strain TUFC12733) TaxID=1330018 RepID=A0A167HN91_CALVF|nr:hypothetical protein CALVIDRAFT_335789 [Calocera viscosa TUFC12733]
MGRCDRRWCSFYDGRACLDGKRRIGRLLPLTIPFFRASQQPINNFPLISDASVVLSLTPFLRHHSFSSVKQLRTVECRRGRRSMDNRHWTRWCPREFSYSPSELVPPSDHQRLSRFGAQSHSSRPRPRPNNYSSRRSQPTGCLMATALSPNCSFSLHLFFILLGLLSGLFGLFGCLSRRRLRRDVNYLADTEVSDRFCPRHAAVSPQKSLSALIETALIETALTPAVLSCMALKEAALGRRLLSPTALSHRLRGDGVDLDSKVGFNPDGVN